MTFIQQQIENISARIAKWEKNLAYDIRTGNEAEAEYSRRALAALTRDREFWQQEQAAEANRKS